MAGDVNVELTGNASPLTQALEEIQKELKQTKEAVSSLTSQFSNLYLSIKGAVEGVQALFRGISFIHTAAADMEQTALAFRVMLGDAEAAGAYVSNLRDFAAKTPFEFQDIADAGKTLLAMGTEANKSVQVIKLLGDVASVSGKPLKELAFLYAKVQNAGLTNEVAESLEMQGVPIRRLLAEMKGISFEQVFQGISKRQFDVSDLDAVLAKLTGSGGLLENMTLLQSQTFGGMLSTLLDNVKALAIELGTPINAALIPVFQDIINYLAEIQPQVTEFAESFSAAFSTAAEAITPILSGISSFVSAIGGAKTIVASAAVAMLMFVGATKEATVSTVSLTGKLSSMVSVMRGLSMASFTNAFKSGLASLKSAFSITLAGMRVTWSVAWATMATAARVAMLAVKTALVSTGIGLIVVAIGEALGAVYNWFMSSSEAAKEAAESAKQFAKALQTIEKNAAKVTTQDQYDTFMESLEEKIEALREARKEAYDNEEYEKGDQMTQQLAVLWEKKRTYQETLPLQIEEANRARKAAEQMKRQKEEAEALAKKIATARDKLDELVQKQRESERERYLKGMDNPELEIKLRLSDVGMASLDALKAKMDELSRSSITQLGDDAEYQKLVTTYNKILDLQDASIRKEKERAVAVRNYDGQVAALEAEVAGNTKLVQQYKEQQRIVQLTEQYRKAGMADAEARARRLVELEQQKVTNKAETDYSRQIELLQAQISGDQERLASVKAQQRIVQLTEQYRQQGLANAEQKAKQLVALEQRAEEAAKVAAKTAEKGQRISDSMAQVGGGGRSVVIGGPMLSESKKHTQLLQEMGTSLRKPQTVKLSGNLKAVLGR